MPFLIKKTKNLTAIYCTNFLVCVPYSFIGKLYIPQKVNIFLGYANIHLLLAESPDIFFLMGHNILRMLLLFVRDRRCVWGGRYLHNACPKHTKSNPPKKHARPPPRYQNMTFYCIF